MVLQDSVQPKMIILEASELEAVARRGSSSSTSSGDSRHILQRQGPRMQVLRTRLLNGTDDHHHIQLNSKEPDDDGVCSTEGFLQVPSGKPPIGDDAAQQQKRIAKRARFHGEVEQKTDTGKPEPHSHWAQLEEKEEYQERKEKKSGTRKRWAREEILALINVRVSLDGEKAVPRHLWKEVERRMGGLGHQRSAPVWMTRFNALASRYKRMKNSTNTNKSKPYWFTEFGSAYSKLHDQRVENDDMSSGKDHCDDGSYHNGGGNQAVRPQTVKVESFSGHDEKEGMIQPEENDGTDSKVSSANGAGVASQQSADSEEEGRMEVCRGAWMEDLEQGLEEGLLRMDEIENDSHHITLNDDVDQMQKEAMNETKRAQDKGSHMMQGVENVMKEMMERQKALQLREVTKIKSMAKIFEARVKREKAMAQHTQDLDWKELETLKSLASYLETSAKKFMVMQDERERDFAESIHLLEQEERLEKNLVVPITQQLHERSQTLEVLETFLCKDRGDSSRSSSL